VLTSNRLAHLADLDPLRGLKKLTHLVLLDNPVARRPHYRSWVVWRCPSVRFLDFAKVRAEERKAARELFGGVGEGEMTELAREILRVKSAAAAAAAVGSAADVEDEQHVNGAVGGRVKLKPEESKRVEALIRNAKSLAEIERLESELSKGRIPPGVLDSAG
jgi:U2 small nuclear ribonucleoprotein A'